MPVIIGYGLLGTSLFWRSERFKDFNTSMFTLFASMNGDVIWDTWHDINSIHFLFAQLFLYSFILLSISVIFNVFIVIIEDGYVMQKFFARTDWVRGVNQKLLIHEAESRMNEKTEFSGRSLDQPSLGSIDSSRPLQRLDTQGPSDFGSKSGKPNIPMLHGAPIPHDGDPFIRIIKKTKKDVKSREALVKMLRHEKLDILNARNKVKMDSL